MTNQLPFDAVVFDLDGVITRTALVHSVAWKEMFDNYLLQREKENNEPFKEFTHEGDYLKYVDGKPRYEGVKSFLESRGITIPYGNPDDSTDMETCCGIGNRKNEYFNRILDRDGVKVYESTVALMHELKAKNIRIGVASSSKNCEMVLRSAGLLDMIETRVDGVVSAELGLKGKPEPDIFTTAADNLGTAYDRTIIVEDAISGVQAGRKGNFGLVLGLAREDNHYELKLNGADIVVSDISEIGFSDLINWFENGLKEDSWSLTYLDYLPEKERSREALLSVGNGYFGTRGAMEEVLANKINYPATYMAGVFNRLISKVSGRDVDNEDFVNTINWIPITFKVDDGDWFDVNLAKIISIERKLDMKTATFYKSLTVETADGKQTNVYTRRFASMANPNIGAIHFCMQPINYSGKITFKSLLDGSHINAGVARYAELNQNHLEPVGTDSYEDYSYLEVKTTESNIKIQAAANHSVMYNGDNVPIQFSHNSHQACVETIASFDIKAGEYLGFVKTVYLSNSHSNPVSESFESLMEQIPTFEAEFEEHKSKWESLWEEVDIQIEGDRLTQKLLRLHLYHLMSGTSIHNLNIDFGIPARGLTGEAYRGHIFWDELYILPFYFVHYPEIARSVLMYRYRRLDAARSYAKEFGYKGAMFPWQSGSDGREETQKFHFNPISGKWGDDHSSLQRHVSLAIAYNIIQYFKFSEDKEFMLNYGLEMLLEINRFWQSKCELNPKTNRYDIDKVMGPDEFHEGYPESETGGLRNNAYTNIMTVWMAEETQNIFNLFDSEDLAILMEKLSFSTLELNEWVAMTQKLSLEISEEGIISQYEGYFDLKELDWKYYEEKYGNVHRMDRVLKAEGLSPDDFKVAKQADALMTFYNLDNERVTQIVEHLGYQLPKDYIQRNLDYYLKRTSHGSTLSRVVHAYLASQLGNFDLSWSMYHEAINSDYNDIQGGTTAEGIHTGVMAGTIWILISTFAGIRFEDKITANPNLPKHWRSLKFKLKYKGVRYGVSINSNKQTTISQIG